MPTCRLWPEPNPICRDNEAHDSPAARRVDELPGFVRDQVPVRVWALAFERAHDTFDGRFFAEDPDLLDERTDGLRFRNVQLEGRAPRLPVRHRPLAKGGNYAKPQEQVLHLPGEPLADRTVTELGLAAGEDRGPAVGRE